MGSAPGAALFAALALSMAVPVDGLQLPAATPPAELVDTLGEVDLRTILQHHHWLGRPPRDPYWGADGNTLYFEREAASLEVDGNEFDPRFEQLYRLDVRDLPDEPLRDTDLEPIPTAELGSSEVSRRVRNVEATLELFVQSGDLHLIDLRTGTKRQLTRTSQRESSPFFYRDGRVGFVRDHTVYALHLEQPLLEQVLQVRGGAAPLQELADERREAKMLQRQQARLFDWVRDEQAREQESLEREQQRRDVDSALPAAPVFLGESLVPRAVVPSPSGTWALVLAGPKDPPQPRGDKMPAYVSADGYVEVRDVRPKVGDASGGDGSLFLVDIERGTKTRITLDALPGILDDPLADLREAAERRERERKEALARENGAAAEESDPPESDSGVQSEADSVNEAGNEATATGEDQPSKENEKKEAAPRAVDFGQISWNRSGSAVVFQAFSTDNKDRWIARVPLPENGTTNGSGELAARALLHDHDPAWINWRYRDLAWLPDDRHLLTLSERSGFSQLYRLDAFAEQDTSPQALTTGEFVVDSPQIAASEVGISPQWIYFLANFDDPGSFEVYRIPIATSGPVAGSRLERITRLGGNNSFELSPDGARLALLHSTSMRPPELFVQAAEPSSRARQITSLVSEEFLALPWIEPEIVDVPSSQIERPIRARLFLPDAERFPPGSRPAAFFVHGAGYLQNAHRGWSTYFRETLFSTLLAQRGYVVLDMDYRGSAGYGRDWRTAIYRQMGTPEVEDLADGVRYLVDEHGVDRDRIGVWGGSYGGFLTFMAMFTEPDLFAAGAALRPVTDWAHYNHPYTSNILNTPELDPEAYERSSPIEYAEGLQKPLLICAGMLDDNVFFQDSVRLVQRLIELEKENWEMAIYPVEPHGFREPSSWLDEYRRILALFERHLRANG